MKHFDSKIIDFEKKRMDIKKKKEKNNNNINLPEDTNYIFSKYFKILNELKKNRYFTEEEYIKKRNLLLSQIKKMFYIKNDLKNSTNIIEKISYFKKQENSFDEINKLFHYNNLFFKELNLTKKQFFKEEGFNEIINIYLNTLKKNKINIKVLDLDLKIRIIFFINDFLLKETIENAKKSKRYLTLFQKKGFIDIFEYVSKIINPLEEVFEIAENYFNKNNLKDIKKIIKFLDEEKLDYLFVKTLSYFKYDTIKIFEKELIKVVPKEEDIDLIKVDSLIEIMFLYNEYIKKSNNILTELEKIRLKEELLKELEPKIYDSFIKYKQENKNINPLLLKFENELIKFMKLFKKDKIGKKFISDYVQILKNTFKEMFTK